MWDKVNQRINSALNAIRKPFRARLNSIDSSGKVQTIQAEGLAKEPLQGQELFQQYGLTSNPPPGTMAVVIPVGGKTSHGIVVATEHGSYRLAGLKSGEVALYTDEGAKIVLKRGKIIETDCDVFRVNCKEFEVNAESKADFNTRKSPPVSALRPWNKSPVTAVCQLRVAPVRTLRVISARHPAVIPLTAM
ncbi:phage baseplate assembly protein V [Morganella morganii]